MRDGSSTCALIPREGINAHKGEINIAVTVLNVIKNLALYKPNFLATTSPAINGMVAVIIVKNHPITNNIRNKISKCCILVSNELVVADSNPLVMIPKPILNIVKHKAVIVTDEI